MSAVERILMTTSSDEDNIVSMMTSNRLLMNDSLEFLFQNNEKTAPLFLMSGNFGMFISGVAAHSGIKNILMSEIPPQVLDSNFKKVIIIVGTMRDEMNPVEIWRETSKKLFPSKERNVFIEIRCLVDERTKESIRSSKSIENSEMVFVRSLASKLPD